MEPVIQLLSELIAIPSVNPMGRNVSGSRYEEKEIAEFIAGVLRKNKIDVQIQEVGQNRPNVIGYVDKKKRQTLLLEAHMDTVDGEEKDFQPVVRDGNVYGRGACDTKASIAAFLQSVIDVIHSADNLQYNILLLFSMDEEYTFSGANFAATAGLKADFGIAGEPTSLKIIHTHKGVTRFKINARGNAAHSAYPREGVNAIYAMWPVLQRLEEFNQKLEERARHPLLGTASLSVGRITGGVAVNVVPHLCQIEIDRRSLPHESREEIISEIQNLIGDLPAVKLEEPYLSVDGMDVPEESLIIRFLRGSIERYKGSAEVDGASYATNAGVYNRFKIPTVVFGPGDIAQAHTASEYISVNQVHGAISILTDFLTRDSS